MTESTETDMPVGVLLVDKPQGPTSFTIVRQVRHLLGVKKVGHAGSLDPFATGLLIVCVGRPATKLSESLMNGKKEYSATLQLGTETDTQDPEGEVISTCPVPELTEAEICQCLEKFVGRQLQTPPQYSALKHKGKPLYYYARRGITVEKEPREIEIESIRLKWYEHKRQQLGIDVICSRGTYIRTLASDIGKALGCGAYLIALRRLRSGLFSLENSVPGEMLKMTAKSEQVLSSLLPVSQVQAMIGG